VLGKQSITRQRNGERKMRTRLSNKQVTINLRRPPHCVELRIGRAANRGDDIRDQTIGPGQKESPDELGDRFCETCKEAA